MAPRATTPTTAAAIVAAYVAGAPVKVICAQYFISRFVMTQAAPPAWAATTNEGSYDA